MLTHLEYLQLIVEVNRLRNQVHLFNNEEISEAALDDLKHKITQFEAENPDQISPNSPNYTIAGGVLEKFEKFTHKRRMLSLTDVFDFSELQAWENRWIDYAKKEGVEIAANENLEIPLIGQALPTNPALTPTSTASSTENVHNFTYICEPKLDGLAISLHFDGGKLVTAVTRGDGFVGELVTENVRQIKNIPRSIPYLGKIEVRGEVFISKKDFQTLNTAIAAGQKTGKMNQTGPNATFANSRNAASGTIRQLNSSIVAERNLSFVAYNLFVVEE